MSQYKIAVSEVKDQKISLEKAFEAIGGMKELIQEGNIVFIKIDLPFPEGYPTTFNPNLLKCLIDICIEAGAAQINIGCVPNFNISSEYIWNSLGFSNFFENEEVHFIPLESDIIEKKEIKLDNKTIMYPKAVLDADIYISMVNPKINFNYNLNLSIINSYSLISWSDQKINIIQDSHENYCISDKFLKDKSDFITDIFLIKPPDLVVYDFSALMIGAGPLIYSDSKIIDLNRLIISNNGAISDVLIMEMLNIDISDNKLIKAIKEKEISIIERKNIEEFIIIKETEDKIENLNVITDYLENGLSKIEKLNLNDNLKIPMIDEIFPKRAEICKGNICTGCNDAAMQLIFLLKTHLIKDIQNIDNFSIILGENPMEPMKEDNLIVFGDCAINTTEKSNFRQIKDLSKAQSEEEFNTMIIKFQAEIRNKRINQENKNQITEENIQEEFKNEPTKLQDALESLKIKFEKFNKKMDDKYKKFVEKQTKKHQKELEKDKKIKYKPNNSILEIPGCPPEGFEFLLRVIKLLNKDFVPSLNNWNDIIERFYDRSNYSSLHKDFTKQRKIKAEIAKLEDKNLKKTQNEETESEEVL